MLPDYPKFKQLLSDAFRERMIMAKERCSGVFSGIKKSKLHEGSRCQLFRTDGSSDEIEMQHVTASGELQHDLREIEKLAPEAIIQLLDTMGERMAFEEGRLLFKRLDEAVRSVGNVIEGPRPFLEQFFEMLERVQMDFEPDGTPCKQQMVFGSNQAAQRAWDQVQQIERDPELKKRYDRIIEQKRQEWRDREATRNLVD